MRGGRRPAPRAVAVALAAVAATLVVVNVFAERSRSSWDLTAERSATLSDETLRVLEGVDEPIRIVAAFGRDHAGRVEAATLLSRYRRANRRISWEIVDPRLSPGVLDQLRGMVPGSAAVFPRGRPQDAEIAQFAIEIDLTSAIARLLRETSGRVCFTTGHGERPVDSPAPEAVSRFADLLRDNGYETATIDLLASPDIPEGCDAVVVADPTSPLGEPALEALDTYLRASGKSFVLADPASTVDVSPVTSHWGIRFVRGIVVEGDPGSRLPEDPVTPIVRRYDASNPSVRGIGPTIFPGAEALVVEEPEDRPGLAVAPIAITSEEAYLERFETGENIEGPLTVAAAADDSRVVGRTGPDPRIRRTRILAVSDVDFLSNRFLGEAANARLAIQGVDWLTQPEPLLAAVPNFPQIRELELTEARSRSLLLVSAAAVPAMFLLAGGFVWVFRRGR